jgi:hypothetical protein
MKKTSEYRDTLQICIESYGDNWQAYYAASEIAYYYEHGELPDWSTFIQCIERYEGGHLIVHRDPEGVH